MVAEFRLEMRDQIAEAFGRVATIPG